MLDKVIYVTKVSRNDGRIGFMPLAGWIEGAITATFEEQQKGLRMLKRIGRQRLSKDILSRLSLFNLKSEWAAHLRRCLSEVKGFQLEVGESLTGEADFVDFLDACRNLGLC